MYELIGSVFALVVIGVYVVCIHLVAKAKEVGYLQADLELERNRNFEMQRKINELLNEKIMNE